MEVSVGFSFRILRIISCKRVISVRVFQKGILAGVPECAPHPHSPCRTRGFLCWPGKAQPWAIIGASLVPTVLWGFCTGPFMGSWGWRQPGCQLQHLLCSPPACPLPGSRSCSRSWAAGSTHLGLPLSSPRARVRSLHWGFIIGAPHVLLPGHYALHPRPLCNNPQPLFSL